MLLIVALLSLSLFSHTTLTALKVKETSLGSSSYEVLYSLQRKDASEKASEICQVAVYPGKEDNQFLVMVTPNSTPTFSDFYLVPRYYSRKTTLIAAAETSKAREFITTYSPATQLSGIPVSNRYGFTATNGIDSSDRSYAVITKDGKETPLTNPGTHALRYAWSLTGTLLGALLKRETTTYLATFRVLEDGYTKPFTCLENKIPSFSPEQMKDFVVTEPFRKYYSHYLSALIGDQVLVYDLTKDQYLGSVSFATTPTSLSCAPIDKPDLFVGLASPYSKIQFQRIAVDTPERNRKCTALENMNRHPAKDTYVSDLWGKISILHPLKKIEIPSLISEKKRNHEHSIIPLFHQADGTLITIHNTKKKEYPDSDAISDYIPASLAYLLLDKEGKLSAPHPYLVRDERLDMLEKVPVSLPEKDASRLITEYPAQPMLWISNDLSFCADEVIALQESPDKKLLALITKGQCIILLKTEGGYKKHSCIKLPDRCQEIAWDHTSAFLAVRAADKKNSVALCAVRHKKIIAKFHLLKESEGLCWDSPDHILYTGSCINKISLVPLSIHAWPLHTLLKKIIAFESSSEKELS